MHDVFISHSSKDKAYAEALCAKLESQEIQCWIAPRNIMPGMEWGAAIIDAIESSRLMVLLLTTSADASPQIVREVERAVSKGLRIVPLRVEDIKPGKNLEYFLGTPHWLDALPPPFENHLDRIAETIKALLENRDQTGTLETPATTQIRVPAGGSLSARFQAIGIAALAILLIVGSHPATRERSRRSPRYRVVSLLHQITVPADAQLLMTLCLEWLRIVGDGVFLFAGALPIALGALRSLWKRDLSPTV